MIGYRYGKWEVLAIIEAKPEDICEVICDCGDIKMVKKYSLVSGGTTQCVNCYHNIRQVPDEVY